jgi:hypothetical protein
MKVCNNSQKAAAAGEEVELSYMIVFAREYLTSRNIK